MFQRRISRRALFSPPPRAQDNVVPPVPPIPIPFREPPPLRYRPPPDYAAGVFRPMDRPFAFEHNLRQRYNREMGEQAAANGNADAPDPERRRNMGLGGAVLMLNRQRQAAEQIARRREQEDNLWVNLGVDTLGFIRRVFGFRQNQDGEDEELLEALAMSHVEHAGGLNQQLYPSFLDNVPNRVARNAPVEYRPAYTHPSKPQPGFSNNFSSPDVIAVDQPGPSSTPAADAGTILVCAKCLDPLVMNVTGPEDEVRKSRLWALRCGHMLDGKCIEQLMKPPLSTNEAVETKAQAGSSSYSAEDKPEDANDDGLEAAIEYDVSPKRDKGKRKANALDDERDYVPADRKGKGRAGARLDVPVRNHQAHSEASSSQTPDNSIRSRLRPRKPVKLEEEAFSNDIATEPVTEQAPHYPESSSQRSRGRRRVGAGRGGRSRVAPAKGKGKGKAKAPVIEARHEWSCPICQHQHWSVLIDGVWKMDEEGEKGAIALYV